MKDFKDFIMRVNTSDSIQHALESVPLNLEKSKIDISTRDGFEKLSHAFEERMLNQFMQILEAYHNWLNEK